MPPRRALPLIPLAFALLAGCRGDAPDAPATATAPEESAEQAAVGEHWRYRASVVPGSSHGISQINVQLCFDKQPSGRLVPINSAATDYIEQATNLRNREHLAMRKGTLDLSSVRAGDCISYRVDVSAMAQREGLSRMVRAEGDSVLLRASMWLWHPGKLSADVHATLELELPEGIEASVPWDLVEGDRAARAATYRLPPTTFRWLGYTGFGKLQLDRFEVHGTQIEIAALDRDLECSKDGRRAWVTDAVANSAALFDGTFPRDHLQVLIVPVGGTGGVRFGMAGRGGGAGIYILLSEGSTDQELPGGWTTVHEVLHHTMPFVDDAWMAEGWVSYYTELMRTRTGHRDEAAGWARLADAFNRGRRTRRRGSLRSLSENMHENFAYQRVYWGGGAIAFLTDIALRKDSGGEKSLDDAMHELRRCCGDAYHKWSADELLGKLDSWYGKPLFTQTAQPILDGADFPDVDAAFDELGVSFVDGRAVLDDAHPGAQLRRGIMAPRPARAAP